MKNLTTIGITILTSVMVVLFALNTPASWYNVENWFTHKLGAVSLTDITGTTQVSAYPAVQNANNTIIETHLNNLIGTTTSNQITSLPNLVTVGTIGTGVFQGTSVKVGYGGTGLTSVASSSLLFGKDSTSLQAMATSSLGILLSDTTGTLPTSRGGTATTTWLNGGLVFFDTILSSLSQAQTQAAIFYDKTNSRLGIASSSPAYELSLGSGQTIGIQENALATSTNMTVDARDGNQQLIQMGTSATTISFSNFGIGTTIRLVVCNPGSTAGAITWSGVRYFGGSAPAQTTTANQCDMYVVGSTAATSTGAATPIIWLGQGGVGLQ